jgi:hypothetical protein
MKTSNSQYRDLSIRRRELGIPYSALSQISGVSQPSVQRLLSGRLRAPRFDSVIAVARALELDRMRILEDGSLKFEPTSTAQQVREKQARRKAELLVGMVQGTSALEGQAVSDAAIRAMVDSTFHKLLAGSNHRLWS